MIARAAVLSLTLATACGQVSDNRWSGCPAATDGIVIVTWTVRSQTASVASCTGIDHLALSVAPFQCGGATIEPIPCTAGRIRYDNFPRGLAQLELDGLTPQDVSLVRGLATFDIEPNAAATPAAIDLR